MRLGFIAWSFDKMVEWLSTGSEVFKAHGKEIKTSLPSSHNRPLIRGDDVTVRRNHYLSACINGLVSRRRMSCLIFSSHAGRCDR